MGVSDAALLVKTVTTLPRDAILIALFNTVNKGFWQVSLEEVDKSDGNADIMPEMFCATIAVLVAAINCFMLVLGGTSSSMAHVLED